MLLFIADKKIPRSNWIRNEWCCTESCQTFIRASDIIEAAKKYQEKFWELPWTITEEIYRVYID